MPITTMMPAGSPEKDPPPGFVGFCLRFGDQCSSAKDEAPVVALTPAVWSEIAQVNRHVNADIWPEEDRTHYGRAEYWTIPTDGYGDCDDYALTKRQQLAKLGLPMKALRMAVAITPQNDRHAVLTVATDHGDFVLDNLTDDIRGWEKTGYRWLARQDAANDWGWVTLDSSMKGIGLATAETGAQN
ncbi:putative transglutaminase-like cysteine proteinase [Rhizomicrobium palustre]|uniref:Putative transglutaminase-like cysteine proteinase n=1 Tax=Rhizomicrobium palustre TaxID=189966 RepID=A0A846MTL1_9PROT|nr:transglutaminase-like cysteine peptidase [Rhizomicrobium palustre]NIK86774.1 putative transglutaminase-like cysteine proteinase [Rhizomicrobium palustre]